MRPARETGAKQTLPHPGDALEAEFLGMFPDATLADDDGPRWETVVSAPHGVVQVRNVATPEVLLPAVAAGTAVREH